MRSSIVVMPLLAIALTRPVWAQPTNTVDQQTRQQVEALVASYLSAVNKGDGQALVALYAPNFIRIDSSGKRTADAEIQTQIEEMHKRGETLAARVDAVEPLFGEQGIVATAPYEGTFANDPGAPRFRGNYLLCA